MRWVVFLRAANVGKHNRFQPRVVVQRLDKFGVVNIGAVGTFAVRENVTESALRKALAAELDFKCEMMIRPAREIVDLVRADPFKGEKFEKDRRGFATILAKTPANVPKLPICVPATKDWEVKIVSITGACALSVWRRLKANPLYPNEVIEKLFQVPTTTRSWSTIEKLAELL